ncbi:AmmeMemoRadiSam system radical SAM enzyme [Desulfobulbus rhabdoformis]|uniref:AmmeMemoRadiSam system radical SAM enzyme n=1 Tax=Desulfobulbus rhabdoformis TaxID=34032 RepID=UPI001963FDAA|nr:AmmeMemoRadiSam system radical SAM enzyme [Desulfobulbus rhabdoformis]MBM9614700.1 AmmeMemoRadiSam system radical SAM enzyme [Desulfobulbus rhabdoformis]
MHEALFYQQESDGSVSCHLCHHRCHIQPGKRGRCGVRENHNGQLISLVYGMLVAESVDPIEKKPLFHLLPGSRSYSISTVGCNFHCLHCQNYEISQYPQMHQGQIAGSRRSPAMVVEQAVKSGCASISYTYVEPTIFYEFAFDCSTLARKEGLKNIFVSNGFMTAEVVRHLAPVLDGINIDLKSFQPDFYRKVCKAQLEPVCENIRLFYELGVVVEVTTLVIPGLNDSEDELRQIARFLVSISPDIPWHVSGFRPTYHMVDRPSTSMESLIRAREIGIEEGLRYVYTGNLAIPDGEDTFCPSCSNLVIHRQGFNSQVVGCENGHCSHCGNSIYGVWK